MSKSDEQFYDSEIVPLLKTAVDKCAERGISLLASVQYMASAQYNSDNCHPVVGKFYSLLGEDICDDMLLTYAAMLSRGREDHIKVILDGAENG